MTSFNHEPIAADCVLIQCCTPQLSSSSSSSMFLALEAPTAVVQSDRVHPSKLSSSHFGFRGFDRLAVVGLRPT